MLPERASDLQKGSGMKRHFVAILAVVALTGCGLEMNETLNEDGTITTSDGTLLAAPSAGDAGTVATLTVPTQQYIPVPAFNPRGLPQDPVPMKGPTASRSWDTTPSDDP